MSATVAEAVMLPVPPRQRRARAVEGRLLHDRAAGARTQGTSAVDAADVASEPDTGALVERALATLLGGTAGDRGSDRGGDRGGDRNSARNGHRPREAAPRVREAGAARTPAAAFASAIAAFARVRTLHAGAAVFTRTERARSAVLLARGDVALGLRRDGQCFEVERIAHAPAWLDLATVWLGAPHAIDACAHGDCVVVELPLEPLREHLAEQPALALRVIQGLARELQARSSQASGLIHQSAPARLAHWLHDHARASVSQPGGWVVELSERKRDLAAQLAIAPETLSRLLRRLADDGVIDVAGYTVRLRDRDALERMARV
ncbi:MAG: Crp/Fnr family transcriptional regulator [Ideonella sp.]|nr:Crp/Fnr family transcriptional regulator [Ideonella sp.]MCC7455709.1 Crp/Fnr family transcriptional regulator [Nitrospira sp.]